MGRQDAAVPAFWALLALAWAVGEASAAFLSVGGRRGGGSSGDAGDSPVTRVVKLLQEMKEQVEAEAKEDDKIYGKMSCWCKTNDKAKTDAIKAAEVRIEELSTVVAESAARGKQLGTEIGALKDDIQENEDSMDKAAAMREKEKAEFEDEEKDMMDAAGALKEAVEVLSRVQLLQGKASQTAVGPSLVQARELVSRVSRAASLLGSSNAGIYRAVMQKDLWDLLSALPGDAARDAHVITGLEQQPTGHAAGAVSYSAKSSSILGLLKEMKATFDKNLGHAHKEEIDAEVAFQRLRSAKEGEVQAAGQAVEEKSAELAELNQRQAQAKEDIEETQSALSADEQFLMDLKKRCVKADSEYEVRSKTRQEEVLAIAEAIHILSEDDARDLFSKTMSLLQVGSQRHRRGTGEYLRSTSHRGERAHAASELLALAKRQRGGAGGWRLATLAVGVQLDGFEKVKELMDKMIVELKKQQQEEYEKRENCNKDLDANEDEARSKTSEEKDLKAKMAGLEGTLASLAKDLEDLRAEVAESQVSLKRAGENRKAENHEFQQAVSDQRTMIAILLKALDRLQGFYGGKPKALLALRSARSGVSMAAAGARAAQKRQEPQPPAVGPPPPPAGKAYSQSGMSGGVIQMLEKIVQDARKADQEAVLAEQASEGAYSQLVADVNAAIDAAQTAIAEKSAARGQAEAERLQSKQDLEATQATLGGLAEEAKALHLSCDFLVKNHVARQQARQEEVEAIQEAKAILSGANLGAGEV